MYSLDINFLQDRAPDDISSPEVTKQPLDIKEYIPAGIGLGVGLLVPGLVFLVLMFIQGQETNLNKQIAELELKDKQLQTKIADINKLKKETEAIEDQTEALVTVFDRIRPWSAMLRDLRDLTPGSVQVETIQQITEKPGRQRRGKKADNKNKEEPIPTSVLEISGYARSYSDVNDFVLTLGKSDLFDADKSNVTSSQLIDAPPITGAVPPENKDGKEFKPPQVVQYTIKTTLSSTPASELMRELEKKGTVGLVNRINKIRNLQKNRSITK